MIEVLFKKAIIVWKTGSKVPDNFFKWTLIISLDKRTMHLGLELGKYPPQMEAIVYVFLNFQNCACYEKYLKDNKHKSLHLTFKICSNIGPWTLSVLQSSQFSSSFALGTLLCSLEEIISADKYQSIFWCQMEAIVCVLPVERCFHFLALLKITNTEINFICWNKCISRISWAIINFKLKVLP